MVEILVIILGVLIFDIIFTGLVFGVLYKRYQQTQIKAVLLATIFFALDLLVGITEFAFVSLNPNNLNMIYLDLNQPFPIIFSTLGILGAGTFLLFINYYLREEISSIHVAVVFSVLFSFITYSFMKLYLNAQGSNFNTPSISGTPISFEFLPAILITYLLVVTYPQLFRIIKDSELTKQRNVVIGLIVAMFFYYVNTSVFITLGSQLDLERESYIYIASIAPRISVIIGDIILFATYARIPAAYLHDQKIEKLLVISKSGLLMYSQDFQNTQAQSDGDILLSGGLSALSSMLAESINVSELEAIEFKEKEVLIEHGDRVGFFLITNRPSQFLWNALSSIETMFNKNINLDKILSQSEEIQQEDQLVIEVNEIFGV